MTVNFVNNIGFIVLAIWLIVTNALIALSIGNPIVRIILAVVGVIAGVLLLIGK